MSKPYRPANGTEGMIFEAHYCENCKHGDSDVDGDYCPIRANAFLFGISEPEYPKEWVYTDNDVPTCTKFERAEQ